MSVCVRECVHWRRHQSACPVEDRKAGAWVPWQPTGADLNCLCSADLGLAGQELRSHVHVTPRGTLEIWHACDGCAPRKALHGLLCEQCHLRMAAWLGSDPGSLGWAYSWIAPDLVPSQQAAMSDKIRRGKSAPPAAISVHVLDLQRDIAQTLGWWLLYVTDQFGLHGPDWWRARIEGGHGRRAMAPSVVYQVEDAARYLLTWLDRAEGVEPLVTAMYGEAQELMRRVEGVAPWQPKAQRLKGLACPECERESLVIFTGDEHLTCRRCQALVPRAKYDRWSALMEHERGEKVS